MKDNITMQMIADKLSISKSLVSKALSNRKGVREETRKLIRETAAQMGYRTNSSIMSVSSSKTGNIAVLIPRRDTHDIKYWGKVINGIEEELEKNSFSMIYSGIDVELSANRGIPSCIIDRKVDGVILLGYLPSGYILEIFNMDIPMVHIDPSFDVPGIKLNYVMADNYGGGYDAANYLIKKGHKKLGFVGDINYSISFKERYRGFNDAVENTEHENVVARYLIGETDSNTPFNDNQVKKIINSNDFPDAFFCCNDPIALAVLDIAKGYNLLCPEDISIMGFDNISECELTEPKLTSVDACKTTLGRRAVDLVICKLKEPQRRPEYVFITTSIIERNSVL